MVTVAESDTPPEGYYEKSGDFDLAPELGAIANKLRGINGISNKLVIVPSAIHEAYTNMEYISLSGDYMAMAMIDNYHGDTTRNRTPKCSPGSRHRLEKRNCYYAC